MEFLHASFTLEGAALIDNVASDAGGAVGLDTHASAVTRDPRIKRCTSGKIGNALSAIDGTVFEKNEVTMTRSGCDSRCSVYLGLQ